jgi:hypothetical protein
MREKLAFNSTWTCARQPVIKLGQVGCRSGADDTHSYFALRLGTRQLALSGVEELHRSCGREFCQRNPNSPHDDRWSTSRHLLKGLNSKLRFHRFSIKDERRLPTQSSHTACALSKSNFLPVFQFNCCWRVRRPVSKLAQPLAILSIECLLLDTSTIL